MSARKTWFAGSILIAIGLLAGISLLAVPSAAGQSGPTLRVLAGLGRGVVAVNHFIGDPALPDGNTVRIAEGSTVVWTLGSDEPHTITFRAGAPWPPIFMPQPEDPKRAPMYNPLLVFPILPAGPWDGTSFINMELQAPGQELRVTFAKQGKYRYSCLFHEEMDGYVEVVAPGAAGVTTQAAVDQYAATHYADEHAADVDRLRSTRTAATRSEGPDGRSIWFVRAGTNDRRGHVDLQSFLPETLAIAQGDTVVWYVDHVAPHTVTFPSADGQRPDFVAVQLPDGTLMQPPAPARSRHRRWSPRSTTRQIRPDWCFQAAWRFGPGPVHDGRSVYNSGFIGEHPLFAFPLEKTWALTFDTPGTYEYVCLLHEPQGMKATITVQAR